MPDKDGFSNQVHGPLGWTESLDLDTIGTLVRMGLVSHTATMVRKVRTRTFEPGTGLPYEVNAAPGTPAELTERVVG